MLSFIKSFAAEDHGAVTVDWVVLTASVLIFGVLIVSQVSVGADEMADGIETALVQAEVTTIEFEHD